MAGHRVLIVDDHRLVREGIRAMIELRDPSLTVVGMAADGAEALALVESASPDVVLMDLRMPGLSGIEATARIREKYPHVRVIALTTFEDEDLVIQALQAGAVGYLLKDISAAELVEAIYAAGRGGAPISPSVAAQLVQKVAWAARPPESAASSPPLPLSEREEEILRLIVNGLDNAAIASRLYISKGTVKNHVSHIYERLGVKGRAEAVAWAVSHGIVPDKTR
mgnify:FL=1